jgi:hypothetical protein
MAITTPSPRIRKFIFATLGILAIALVLKVAVSDETTNASDLRKESQPRPNASESARSLTRSETAASRANRATRTSEEPINPQSAAVAFGEAAEIKDVLEQANKYREIIKELCEAGYTWEAWELIIQEPGYNRDSQIWAFFFSANLDNRKSFELIRDLSDPKERQGALQAYLARNPDNLPAILADAEFQRLTQEMTGTYPNALVDVIGGSLRANFDAASTDEEKEKAMSMIVELHSKNLVSNEVLATMIVRNRDKNPFDLWSWISESTMGSGEFGNDETAVRKGIIQGMVFEDAEKALTEISTNSGKSGDSDLFVGLGILAENNPKAANNWYLSQKSNLTSSQQDHAAKAFAMVALRYGESQNAENWANQISNPDLRKSVIERIHPPQPADP